MSSSLPPNATEQFLLAAKRAEIQSLQRLAHTCKIVISISDLIHSLQRERGLSNVFFASQGKRLSSIRLEQVKLSEAAEVNLRNLLHQHYLENFSQLNSPRLLSCIAFVTQGLDDLAQVRRYIDQLDNTKIDAETVTHAFSRLVAGLLAIIFEAADGAGDPAVSRALIALLHFMQGKEYAGQERAWAAIGLASGKIEPVLQERLADLKSAQDRTFSLFEQFAQLPHTQAWQEIEKQEFTQNLASLRNVIQQVSESEPLSSEISEVWYDLATQRIDAMHSLELTLCRALLDVCQQQQEKVERHLLDQENILANLPQENNRSNESTLMLLNTQTPVVGWASGATLPSLPYSESATDSSPATRSVYDLLRDQAKHLEQTRKELEETRRALSERKLVERAKAMLMKSLNISEDLAYRKIQQRAMDSNLRLGEVSEIIISTINATTQKTTNNPGKAR